MSATIDRPDIGYDDDRHAYTIDGEPVVGVSTVAKVCADPAPLIGWAFRLGRDGADTVWRERTARGMDEPSPEDIEAELSRRDLTPDATRRLAAIRGNAVHDALEALAQHGTVPDPDDYPHEAAEHVRALLRWYLELRPSFDAVEVIVGSREHGFAGRYDIRAHVATDRLAAAGVDTSDIDGDRALCLIDLKTSRGVYPTEHFPQLAGYELASRAMGYPPTDAQLVLCTTPSRRPPRAFQLVRSWAQPEDFLAYLAAFRAKVGIEWRDPAAVRRRELDAAIIDALGEVEWARSADIAAMVDADGRAVAGRLRSLKGRGLVLGSAGEWRLARS